MTDQPMTLFEGQAVVREALVRARAAADEEEVADLLLAAGWDGLRALDAVVRDEGFWDRLEHAALLPLGRDDLQEINEVMDSGWSGLLERLGY